jgi:hypothetical protein
MGGSGDPGQRRILARASSRPFDGPSSARRSRPSPLKQVVAGLHDGDVEAGLGLTWTCPSP